MNSALAQEQGIGVMEAEFQMEGRRKFAEPFEIHRWIPLR